MTLKNDNSRQPRALVTGGAGFLGPHLVKALLKDEWRVLAIDNLSVGQRDRLNSVAVNSSFEFRQGDITDAEFVQTTVRSFVPNVVFHLAALHFIPYCNAHPSETLYMNVVGTQRLLDAVAQVEDARFIFASTADVYAAADSPHAESDALGSPNVYGVSKLCGEELLKLARRRCPRSKFFAARLFNLFGPGETNPHVIPEVLTNLGRGGPLRLGNLNPRRDYVYVTDVAEALLRLAKYSGDHYTVNVGTGVGTSVSEIVKALEVVLHAQLSVEVDPAKVRSVERQHLVADISLTRRELGWTPKVTLEEGLRCLLAEISDAVR